MSDQQKLSDLSHASAEYWRIKAAALETQLAKALREHDGEIVQMARELTAMRNERDQAIRERDEARAEITRWLETYRAISMAAGFSDPWDEKNDGKDWETCKDDLLSHHVKQIKDQRDALAKALEPFIKYHKRRMEVTHHALESVTSNGGVLKAEDWEALAALERPAPAIEDDHDLDRADRSGIPID